MGQHTKLDRLHSAWRALSGNDNREGWRTIPIESRPQLRLLAARHFPTNDEAILVGFNSVHIPSSKQLPQGNGFRMEKIKHDIPGDSHVWIALSRQSSGSLDMFSLMAEDIIIMLNNYNDINELALLNLFLERVKAWQIFMQQNKSSVLDYEAEIGLIGELYFLKLLIKNNLAAATAISGWQGPLDGLHDFIFGSGAVEVKSTIVAHGFPVIASSLDQFDPSIMSPLFLVAFRFKLDTTGTTLPEFVVDLASNLDGHPRVKSNFETLLLRTGFLQSFSNYYTRRFSHLETKIVLINNDFPGLTHNNTHPAIKKARYELDLSLASLPNFELSKLLKTFGVSS